MTQPLSDSEKQELKALQDERKVTGGHMSDSARLRLSTLQNRAAEEKNKATEETRTK
jgi:hypothetical protein